MEARGRWRRRLAAGLNSAGVLYLVLLLLVGGVTVPMRGMWQDDTLLLRLARQFQGQGFMAAFTPVVTPLRRLYSLSFRLALSTPQPIWTLHLLFGATWLGQALAAGWISRLLMPGRRLTQFLAICLTLTATSDYLTNNLTSLGYNLSALMLLLAVGCSLRDLAAGAAVLIAHARPPAAIPLWAIGLASGVAAAWFAFRSGRAQNPDRPDRTTRTLLLAGIFAAMALIANAAYAGLQMAEIHYRTHILSRTWASLAGAGSAGSAVQQMPPFRAAFLPGACVLSGFGLRGGPEGP